MAPRRRSSDAEIDERLHLLIATHPTWTAAQVRREAIKMALAQLRPELSAGGLAEAVRAALLDPAKVPDGIPAQRTIQRWMRDASETGAQDDELWSLESGTPEEAAIVLGLLEDYAYTREMGGLGMPGSTARPTRRQAEMMVRIRRAFPRRQSTDLDDSDVVWMGMLAALGPSVMRMVEDWLAYGAWSREGRARLGAAIARGSINPATEHLATMRLLAPLGVSADEPIEDQVESAMASAANVGRQWEAGREDRERADQQELEERQELWRQERQEQERQEQP